MGPSAGKFVPRPPTGLTGLGVIKMEYPCDAYDKLSRRPVQALAETTKDGVPAWEISPADERGALRRENEIDFRPNAAEFWTVFDAIQTINAATSALDHDELLEAFVELDVPPKVFAAVLMQVFPPDPETLTPRGKKFWLAVADLIGPDFLAGLRKATAFMIRVESFK